MAKSKTSSAPTGRKMATMKTTGVGTNHCTVVSHRIDQLGSTDLGGLNSGFTFIDPFNSSCFANTVNGIAGSYEFYRIKSMSIELIPTSGTLSKGSIRCAFINNAELMLKFGSLTPANRLIAITGQQGANMYSWALGGVHKYNPSRITTRKWYATNLGLGSTTDEIDRSEETMWAWYNTGESSVAVGLSAVFHITVEFAGLGTSGTNTFLSSMADTVPVIPYYSGDLPPKIILNSRKGSQAYVMEVTKPLPPTPE